MTEVFKQIAEAHARITGWCPLEKALVMASAVTFMRPELVVEIGVWGGRSFIPMAMACRAIDHGRLMAIDPWSAKASVEGFDAGDPQDRLNIEWWSGADHDRVYAGFVEHLYEFGLAGIVDVRRARSDDVEPPDGIGILHVDGSHTEQAIRDVDRFAPKVVSGGLVFTDDDAWSSGAPKIALDHLRKLGFTPLFQLGTGSVWKRK